MYFVIVFRKPLSIRFWMKTSLLFVLWVCQSVASSRHAELTFLTSFYHLRFRCPFILSFCFCFHAVTSTNQRCSLLYTCIHLLFSFCLFHIVFINHVATLRRIQINIGINWTSRSKTWSTSSSYLKFSKNLSFKNEKVFTQ